jgi:hypothetical protein
MVWLPGFESNLSFSRITEFLKLGLLEFAASHLVSCTSADKCGALSLHQQFVKL